MVRKWLNLADRDPQDGEKEVCVYKVCDHLSFHVKEADGCKYRVVTAVEGKKRFFCTRCVLTIPYDKVPGVCRCL